MNSRIFLWTAAAVVIVGASIIAFIPSYLSTKSGNKKLQDIASKQLKGNFTFESAELHWLGPQIFRTISYTSPAGDFSGTCKVVEINSSLLSLLIHKNLGKALITDPSLNLKYIPANPQTPVTARAPSTSKSTSIKKSTSPSLPFNGSIEIQNGSLFYSGLNAASISLEQISSTIEVSKAKGLFQVSTNGITKQADNQGSFDIQSTVFFPSIDAFSLSTQCKIVAFPTEAIAGICGQFDPHLYSLIKVGIGPSFDLNINGTISPKACDLAFGLNSQQLNGQLATILKDGHVTLKNPGNLTFNFTPSFYASLREFVPCLAESNIEAASSIRLIIDQIDVPIKESALDLANLSCAVKISTSPFAFLQGSEYILSLDNSTLALNSNALNDNLQISGTLIASSNKILDFQADVFGVLNDNRRFQSTIRAHSLPLALINYISSPNFKLTEILGPTLDNLEIQADYGNGKGAVTGNLQTPQLKISNLNAKLAEGIKLESPLSILFSPPNTSISPLNLSIAAGCVISLKDGRATLDTPLRATSTLTPTQVQALLSDPNAPRILEPLECTLLIQPFSSDKIQGSLESSALVFNTPLLSDKASFENSRADFIFNEKTRSAEVQFRAQALQNKKPIGMLQLKMATDGADFNDLRIKAALQCTDFSTAVLETLLAPKSLLSSVLGPVLNIELKIASDRKLQTFSLVAKSDNLHVEAQLLCDEKQLQLQGGKAEIDLKVTPGSYPDFDRLLMGKKSPAPPFELLEPSICSLSLKQLSIPVQYDDKKEGLAKRIPTGLSGWDNLSASGNLQIALMRLLNKTTRQTASLSSLNIALDKQQGPRPLNIRISGGVAAKDSASANSEKRGVLDGQVQFSRLFNEQGMLDLPHSQISLQANIQQFPSMLLDALVRASGNADPIFSILFGDALNAQCEAQIEQSNGNIKSQIQSKNTKAALDATIRNGILSLNQDLDAQLIVTPELSDFLFSKVNPLSISGISARNPLTLHIDAQGFAYPLSPYIPANITIPKGKIELGQIVCHNEGNINTTLGVLKLTQISKEKEIQLWFAPIDFSVRSGKTSVERTEILVANAYDIAVWGDIDFVQDYVDMVLGLTADCLEKAFKLKGLPANYVMHLPMKGPMSNVKINSASATAKITALLAWQSKAVTDALGKSGAGAILGGVIGNLATLPDRGAKTPPAKKPFPWDSEPKKKKTSQSNQKKIIKKKDKPLKQLLKVLR